MEEKNNISGSEDSSEEEVEDFDDFYDSHYAIKRQEEVSEAEAEEEEKVKGSPIDTEVSSEKPKSEVVTKFPQTDYRSF